MDDTTTKPDDTEETEKKRGYVPITRRNVMKSVGAVGVLGGYAGAAGATVQECSCEGLGGESSRCFEPDEDCTFCKIDDTVLGEGQTCTVPGTSITVTRENSDCISWNDPNNELDDIALKAGSGDQSCTRFSEFGTDSSGQLCTQDDKEISHITVKHSCGDDNGGPTPSGEVLTCTTAEVDVTGLPANEEVTLTVSFYDCDDVEDTFTADSDGNVTASIDLTAVGRCYCTPTEMTLTDSGGNVLVDSFQSGLAEGFCEPTVEATGDCSTVTASVTDKMIEGCPVKATLYFDECSPTDSVELNASNGWTHDFTDYCYCTPDKVVFEYDAGSQTVGVDPTDEPCEVSVTDSSIDCSTISLSGDGVGSCPVTIVTTFDQSGCSDYETTVNASGGEWSASIDLSDVGRCYCTPTKVDVYEGDSASGEPVDTVYPSSELDCEPTFEETFYCDAVDVSGTGLVEGCDVTATVYTKKDTEGHDFDVTCDGEYTATLSASSPSATVDLSGLPCGCEPDYVEYSYDGVVFDDETESAGPLNCICDDFTDVCKFEWYDDDRNEILFDTWLDCHGGQVKFTNPTYKDGDELVCFDFESTFPVFEVFVKGGGGKDAGNTYTWPCGTMDSSTAPSKITDANGNDITDEWDGQLCANEHPKNGRQTAVSHVTFRVCVDETLDNKPSNG